MNSRKGHCNKYFVEWEKVSSVIPGRDHFETVVVSSVTPGRDHFGQNKVSPTDTHTHEGIYESTCDSKTYDSLMNSESDHGSTSSKSKSGWRPP